MDGLSEGDRRLLDAIMAHIPIGLTLAVPPDVTIVRVSEHGARLLDRPRAALEGVPLDRIEALHACRAGGTAPAAAADLPLTRATLAGEIVLGEEWEVGAGDQRKTVLCNAGPLRDDAGRIVAGIVAWIDITEQKLLQARFQQAIAACDDRLVETNHRMKNHLQIISNLMMMQAATRGPEAREFAAEIERRVSVLARSHEAVCLSRHCGRVELADFLRLVCGGLTSDVNPVRVDAEGGILLPVDVASPLGMIVNEAVCNALKHAYPEDTAGVVEVAARRRAGGLEVTVGDRGVGVGACARRSGSLGMALFGAISRQLGGEFEIAPRPGGGTLFRVAFPLPG